MFRKKLSAFLATALVAVMIPTTFLASGWNTNGGSETIEGDNYSVEPIIEVELPSDLVFGINPLYLDADGDTETTGDSTQIVTAQYMITNYSNVDVLVTANTSAAAGSGVSDIVFLQTNETDATTGELEKAADNKRNVYLTMMLPKTAATITDGEAKLNVNSFTLASGSSSEIGGLVLGSGAATTLFKLDAFENDTLAAGNVSGFEFAGAVDPDAAFVEGDVHVTTVFTLTTLTANQSEKAYEGLELNNASFDATVVQTVSD